MALDLYSKIEGYLDFEDEIYALHKEFLAFIINKNLDNILDIGCGRGYFLENLKLNNIKAFGIDLSSEQIKVCKEKNLNAKVMPLSEVKEKFSCASAIFDVINYIKKEELEEFFKEVFSILEKEAYFIFDVNSYFGFDEIAQGCINIDVEDKFISIDANFVNEKLKTTINLFSKDENNLYKKEKDSIIQQYYKKENLKVLLEKLGFKVEEIKDIFLHSKLEADKYLFICKKV